MRTFLLSIAALTLGAAGCIHITAVPSVQGKGYVIRQTPFAGSFWNCDATAGDPVCYKVTEVPLAAK